MSIAIALVGLLAAVAGAVAVWSAVEVVKLRRELGRNYWTKEVVGRTINAKVGKNAVFDVKEQDKVMGR